MRPWGIFLFLFAVGASAQVAVQGPQSIYDGQTVAAIDLIGNPHRDMEPLRTLIEQKAGEPYSQPKVEASIAALERTGQFPKVEVNVVPNPLGLRLNFLLEPAYYLGMVNFPGATKLFSYTRLLQVADLHDEDPYDTTHVGASEKALQDLLRRNGYFRATIHTDVQIDDRHQLVNLTFSIALGKQAKVARVTLHGADASETSQLLHSLRSLRARLTGALLKPGKTYSPERITAATNLIKRKLGQQHRLASNVHEDPPQYDQKTNRVDVSFRVEVGPLVVVRVTGARLSVLPFMSGREIKKLIPIYSEGTIDRDLVQEGRAKSDRLLPEERVLQRSGQHNIRPPARKDFAGL